MNLPKQWIATPIDPVCSFCNQPTAWASWMPLWMVGDTPEWTSFCRNHAPASGYPIGKLITAGCRFEGMPDFVR